MLLCVFGIYELSSWIAISNSSIHPSNPSVAHFYYGIFYDEQPGNTIPPADWTPFQPRKQVADVVHYHKSGLIH